MSFTIDFTIDAAGRLTRRKRVDDSDPTNKYNQQDFTCNQRNQVTQITNTVVGAGMGTADATRTFGYHGDGSMVTVKDGTTLPSYLAWCAGGRLGFERNDDDIALYRWGPTGLVEFSPPDPENRSRRSADHFGHTTRLTAGAAQDQYWPNVVGEVLAKAGTIMDDDPPRNRVVASETWCRVETTSTQVDVNGGGAAYCSNDDAFVSGAPYYLHQEKKDLDADCEVESVSVERIKVREFDFPLQQNKLALWGHFLITITGTALTKCEFRQYICETAVNPRDTRVRQAGTKSVKRPGTRTPSPAAVAKLPAVGPWGKDLYLDFANPPPNPEVEDPYVFTDALVQFVDAHHDVAFSEEAKKSAPHGKELPTYPFMRLDLILWDQIWSKKSGKLKRDFYWGYTWDNSEAGGARFRPLEPSTLDGGLPSWFNPTDPRQADAPQGWIQATGAPGVGAIPAGTTIITPANVDGPQIDDS